MTKKLPTKISDLREAKYNPRAITSSKLNKLKDSIGLYGDLSGIVFNIRTKTLVSGHQRLKTIRAEKTRIVQKEATDEFGTVSQGYVVAQTEQGEVRIPYRAVDWDIIKEKSANIAANAHGGSFDKEKLQSVLEDIRADQKFDIELTGLDPLTLKSLKAPEQGSPDSEEFPEYGEDLKTEHECPNCSYRW